MDGMLILAFVLGVGDLVLGRIWWHERSRRRKAESHAKDALQQKYKLLDALERKAAKAHREPVVIPIGARPREIREALLERPASDGGGVA